jgi:hypothetical protein
MGDDNVLKPGNDDSHPKITSTSNTKTPGQDAEPPKIRRPTPANKILL